MTVGLQTFLKSGLLSVFLSSTLVVSATEVGVERKRLRIGLFSAGDLTDWQTKVFSGKTRYQLVSDPEDSLVQVVKSTSHSSASGLVKKHRVDLVKTPFLQWRWRVSQAVQTNNEREKRQDDYAARMTKVEFQHDGTSTNRSILYPRSMAGDEQTTIRQLTHFNEKLDGLSYLEMPMYKGISVNLTISTKFTRRA